MKKRHMIGRKQRSGDVETCLYTPVNEEISSIPVTSSLNAVNPTGQEKVGHHQIIDRIHRNPVHKLMKMIWTKIKELVPFLRACTEVARFTVI